MFDSIKKFLIGKSLKTEQLKSQKFNIFWGLPLLSSDAISSVAYAGQEILYVLVPAVGFMAFTDMVHAVLMVILLLFILIFSYRQVIDSYPQGGGAYIVAQDNLGVTPSLIAAAALCIDYILTVAVSISAGAAAITSAFPELLPYNVVICILLIILMTIGNLRGISESAKTFAIPPYLFIIILVITIVCGFVKYNIMGIHPQPIYKIPNFTNTLSLLVFLKAFAAGCTALTGVEAVSNGVPNFKEPAQKNAKIVLLLLGCVSLVLFGGISYLSTIYKAVYNPNMTVIAQLGIQIFGKGVMFYIIQAFTALILVMAANTSYNGFPILLSIIARDGYVPRQFSKRGSRLSYSNGIMFLSFIAVILIICFKGDNHRLLPLYAVGVFVSFTIAQTGMVLKWFKDKSGSWKHKAVINLIGAIISCVTTIVLGVTKFKEGSWIVCMLIPILVFIMWRIKAHYNVVASDLKLDWSQKPKNIDRHKQRNYMIIPIDSLNKSFLKSYNYARNFTDDIIVFHVSVNEEATKKLLSDWEEYGIKIPIVVRKSPYRNLIGPIIKFVESEEFEVMPQDTITVVMPQLVVKRWWQNILHNQTSLFIRSTLLKKRNIGLITLPYIISK
ncbi:amino acid permease [Clostridium tyrobutyricum]|uniref:Amino acid permease n=2 Tax=Clostridium tyrobutyricum TaxID=1519 RepID=W6NK55_CLOTY|nr:APC family permease [Clostridium tyrobutyricum]AND83839.1 aminoacid permease [Clostridium tyrobutyricum]ANP68592.1 amino acid permease [Clostridium tyrobutyricum]MBV4433901.1 APC family permease [Clostridium tyrobutyricum]QNB67065.1 amino acid permease [Clostridium tyrobutyricum]CDL92277.1 Amino acid permease [Clostridium tyrobutyricum DIVETGP]